MSGLDTRFIPLTILQEQFWDKLNDAPMAGGTLTFYQDVARTIPKPVYMLAGNPPDYDYAEVDGSNVITLSSIGTVDDGTGNNLVIYGYPYDTDGNVQLYYMTVYNSDGQFQFSVSGFPNVSSTESTAVGQEKNFIKNGQFVLNNGTIATLGTDTEVAYGGWHYVRNSTAATDSVSFYRFGSPISGGIPSANPRYACHVVCSSPNVGDTLKALEIRFKDVNRFSDTALTLSLFFSAKSDASSVISVSLYKNFGTGGSSPTSTQIIDDTVLDSSWAPITKSFSFGSNVGQAIGANDDDYFSIRVVYKPATTFDVEVTDFALYLGTEKITAYPFGPDSYNDQQIYDILNYAPAATNINTSSVSLSIYDTNYQAVTGTALILTPGTYLLAYNCSAVFTTSAALAGYAVLTSIYNVTDGSVVAGSQAIAAYTTILALGEDAGGNGSATTVVTVTATTTFQVYAKITTTTNLTSFIVNDASLTAVNIGSIASNT